MNEESKNVRKDETSKRAEKATKILGAVKIKSGVKAGVCRLCGLVASGLKS